jgi:hypothetical protein
MIKSLAHAYDNIKDYDLDDENVVKLLVKYDGKIIKHCKRFQSDREMVKLAVSSVGKAIKYCPLFQDDIEIVKLAVSSGGRNIKYCPKFQDNYDVVKLAVENHGDALEFCPKFQDNKEIFISASKYSEPLRFCKILREDREMVKLGVMKNGNSLRFCPTFQNDEEIVKLAITDNIGAFDYSTLKDNEDIMIFVIHVAKDRCHFLFDRNDKFTKNKDIMKLAITYSGWPLEKSPFSNDYEMVNTALKNGFGYVLWFCKEFQNNREMVKLAVSSHGSVLEHCPMFQNDYEIVKLAVSQNGYAIKFCPKFQEDREMVKLAVRKNQRIHNHSNTTTHFL